MKKKNAYGIVAVIVVVGAMLLWVSSTLSGLLGQM